MTTPKLYSAILVDADNKKILSTGDPVNTHAENCYFIKIAERHGPPKDRIGEVLPTNTTLYSTMKPCNHCKDGVYWD
ncbi:hypothetical protein HD806DRAFT_434067 [Xylariaceae sp. AK1471]|nr:hypothetical protein HD806DRAFT_434067 [Xylariaceae sp. AK1471]